MTKKLWDELNIENPIPVQKDLFLPTPTPLPTKSVVKANTAVAVVEESTTEQNAKDEDFEIARKTIKSVLVKGDRVLEEMSNFAIQDQSPRSYEVVANLLKTLADTAKGLVDLHHTKAKIEGGTNNPAAYNTSSKQKSLEETSPSITVDKAVFVGTSRDLVAQLKGLKKKDDNGDENED